MPSVQEQALEMIAWRSVDEYIKGHPKPRLSAKTKHRCKLWVRQHISSGLLREVNINTYFYPIDDYYGEEMLNYAQRTLDD